MIEWVFYASLFIYCIGSGLVILMQTIHIRKMHAKTMDLIEEVENFVKKLEEANKQ